MPTHSQNKADIPRLFFFLSTPCFGVAMSDERWAMSPFFSSSATVHRSLSREFTFVAIASKICFFFRKLVTLLLIKHYLVNYTHRAGIDKRLKNVVLGTINTNFN